jgi:hypothetical protein
MARNGVGARSVCQTEGPYRVSGQSKASQKAWSIWNSTLELGAFSIWSGNE